MGVKEGKCVQKKSVVEKEHWQPAVQFTALSYGWGSSLWTAGRHPPANYIFACSRYFSESASQSIHQSKTISPRELAWLAPLCKSSGASVVG